MLVANVLLIAQASFLSGNFSAEAVPSPKQVCDRRYEGTTGDQVVPSYLRSHSCFGEGNASALKFPLKMLACAMRRTFATNICLRDSVPSHRRNGTWSEKASLEENAGGGKFPKDGSHLFILVAVRLHKSPE